MFNFMSWTWERIPPEMFVLYSRTHGIGKQMAILNTKYVRIYCQCFSVYSWIKPHRHDNEWEIIIGGPKKFRIIPKGVMHDLFWEKFGGSMLSIKIGKKP